MSGTCLPELAVRRALLLIGAVRGNESGEVERMLTRLKPRDLYGLAVTLAAMVPDDQTPADLLAWNDKVEPLRAVKAGLAPHGTHAAFNRHRNDGTEPCGRCWDAERTYQRDRGRRRRAFSEITA